MNTIKTLISLTVCLPAMVHAQTLVSTTPQLRTALLEEFTAFKCGNCPVGHAVAANIEAQHGPAFTTIAIHGGGLAAPSAGQQDFRTPEGNAIWSQFSVFAQPKGMINRGGVVNTGSWSSAVQAVLGQSSPVNIGVASTYDGPSQMLNVDVELYYTGQGAATNDLIFVALTEDHITEWQTDYQNGNHPNYDHRHVLRDFFTPVTGDPVTTTSMGTLVQRTYTLAVDPAWNLSELFVVAYVGEDNGEVHQVQEVAADGGITTGIDDASETAIGDPYPVPTSETITVPIANVNGGAALQLVDATGRTVISQSVGMNANKVQLSVADLTEGVYFVTINNRKAKKVIVSR